MFGSTHSVYQKRLLKKLKGWRKRRSRPLKADHAEAALLLLRLDLDPLRPRLAALYSPSPRGRPPFDPLAMWRAFLLMTILAYPSIPNFAAALRRSSRLATLAGFPPQQTPSLGAFYLFLDRLEDGPYQPNCPHRLRPSHLRKAASLRNLKAEKLSKAARLKQIRDHGDSLTAHLKQQLLAQAAQPRPADLQQRLEDLLIQAAVIASAQRGLLGDLKHLLISGDGSSLPTAASSSGKPTCQCRKQGVYQCKCDRLFSDATADWGWDSYREVYYFGHTFYQHLVSTSGHDLPVHVAIGPASESDFTLSMNSLDRLQKALAENQVAYKIDAVAYDAGHDGLGIYEYLAAKQIQPVIALNERSHLPRPTGTAQRVNAEGVPLCPAGLEMRRHTQTKNHRLYYNCPVKRPTHRQGKTLWQAAVEACPFKVLCQPDTLMGPVVYVRTDSDPRHYPEIARGSPRYHEIMNQRTGCERSNASKKVVHKLGQRVCRSAAHYLIRLYLVSIVEHAKAWLAEDRKRCGQAWASLSDPQKFAVAGVN